MTNQINVDPAEVAKFEAMASRWWDTEGEFKPLHDINPVRLDYIAQRVDLPNANIIEVGCGGGILSESMAAKGANVKGIDLGKIPLSVAQLHAKESSLDISYEMIAAEDIAQREPGEYDVVTCLEMLEHVPSPESIVAACNKLVKPGGHVFFSTLNRNPKSYLFAVIGAEYILNLLPKGTHEYKKFIRPSELDRWCRNNKLSPRELIGMSYNPITKHYWLGRDVSVNYMLHTQKSEL